MNRPDGSAGDANYALIGAGYSRYRRPEPQIAAQIVAALGDAETVLNVGAGAGSYEPTDRELTAVEPSAAMRDQRPAGLAPAVAATAEQLPYAPEVIAVESRRYPPIPEILNGLGGGRVQPVTIPLNCVDGFSEAYYGRPERLLDPGAGRANSAWSFVEPAVHQRFERDLARDLRDGHWDRRHGRLRTEKGYQGSLVLIVADGAATCSGQGRRTGRPGR